MKVLAEYYKIDKESETKLFIAGMQPEEDKSLEREKLELQRSKQEKDARQKDKDLSIRDKLAGETVRHNKRTEQISAKSKQSNPKK